MYPRTTSSAGVLCAVSIIIIDLCSNVYVHDRDGRPAICYERDRGAGPPLLWMEQGAGPLL